MRSKLDLIMDTRYELGNIILYRYDKSMYISSIESDILIGLIQSYRSRFIIAEERENNNIVEHILIEGKYRGRYTISEIYIIIDLIKGWRKCRSYLRCKCRNVIIKLTYT